MSHTIVFVQTTGNKATRIWDDYDTKGKAMDGICRLYEAELKRLNPTVSRVNYELSDLYLFIDGLRDLSALVFNAGKAAYVPHGKEWIKKQLLQHLQRQAR